MSAPITIFISYAHEDKPHLNQFLNHLAALKNDNLVEIWQDQELAPGDVWETVINEKLDTAEIVILFISSAFMASKYCQYEMGRATERQRNGKARVIPVIVDECDWESQDFSKYNALPEEGRAVTTWRNRASAWKNVVKGIRRVVEAIQKEKTSLFAQFPIKAITPPQLSPSDKNEAIIGLNIDVEKTPDELNTDELRTALAAFLRIDSRQITIRRKIPGSVWVEIELPTDAAQRLYAQVSQLLAAPASQPAQALPVPDHHYFFHPLFEFYQNMGEKGHLALKNKRVTFVPYLDQPDQDKRIGLTLIVRPSSEIAANLEAVIARLKAVAPGHFYYEAPRFHFSILSLIDADDPPRASMEVAQSFVKPIREVLANSKPFEIEFNGIRATQDSLIVRGFPVEGGLEQVRNALRERLRAEGLNSDVDKRYILTAAHLTFARFKVQADFEALSALLDKLSEVPLGRMTVNQAHLVLNDFFVSPEKVEVVRTFNIDIPVVKENLPQLGRVIGRHEEHKKIFEAVAKAERPIILASGFGGIGKSTLAKMVGHTYVEEGKPFKQVVWVDVRQYGQEQVYTLSRMLDKIGVEIDPENKIPQIGNLDAKQKRVRDLLASTPTLLIIDNYESLLLDPEEERLISQFLHTLPIEYKLLRLLLTTREISGNFEKDKYKDIPLQALQWDDALQFMKSRATRAFTEAQYRYIHEKWYGLPKYMEITMDMLASVPYDLWKEMYEDVEQVREPDDEHFGDLMGPVWEKRFTEELKIVLMAITLFSGEAPAAALHKVSGLARAKFFAALTSDPAKSGAYFEITPTDGYRVHPLIQVYCQSQLNSDHYQAFRDAAYRQFVEYYVELATAEDKAQRTKELEKELPNIVEAGQIANRTQTWDRLLTLHEAMSSFLRFKGYWQERVSITKWAVEACRQLLKTSEETHDQKEFAQYRAQLARYLVSDMGWLYLRLEKIDDAEHAVQEGLQLYQKIDDLEGIAQATRHLGKAALLRGLDEFYKPTPDWPKHFPDAERFYRDSLTIQERLRDTGQDRQQQIADMYLDFGRLYWLDGQYLWKTGHEQNNQELFKQGLARLEESNRYSKEAMHIFETRKDERGIAKTSGNLGNATKEIARLHMAQQHWTAALNAVTQARQYYQDSYEISVRIARQDEVSHAAWGLAESFKLLVENSALRGEGDDAHALLEQALRLAQQAHDIYTALGGEKDINATGKLVDELTEMLRKQARLLRK